MSAPSTPAILMQELTTANTKAATTLVDDGTPFQTVNKSGKPDEA
jgi:hypothetical protein